MRLTSAHYNSLMMVKNAYLLDRIEAGHTCEDILETCSCDVTVADKIVVVC